LRFGFWNLKEKVFCLIIYGMPELKRTFPKLLPFHRQMDLLIHLLAFEHMLVSIGFPFIVRGDGHVNHRQGSYNRVIESSVRHNLKFERINN